MTARTLLIRLRGAMPGLTDAEFARRIDLAPSVVCKIKRGTAGVGSGGITLAALRRMAHATGIRIGRLAEWWDEDDSAVPESREYSPSAMDNLDAQFRQLAARYREAP